MCMCIHTCTHTCTHTEDEVRYWMFLFEIILILSCTSLWVCQQINFLEVLLLHPQYRLPLIIFLLITDAWYFSLFRLLYQTGIYWVAYTVAYSTVLFLTVLDAWKSRIETLVDPTRNLVETGRNQQGLWGKPCYRETTQCLATW